MTVNVGRGLTWSELGQCYKWIAPHLIQKEATEIENFSREAKPTERNLDLSVTCGLSVVETIKLLFNLSRAWN